MVAILSALVYFPRLGRGGFAATEGHRVIPGWEMLQTGDVWLPRMFGQVYLRKPPGMAWAVAGSSALFGQTEFAARAVSAAATVALAVMTAWFAARWFGRRSGLAAGLAAVLTPLFWVSGRSAELEALNNFASSGCIFVLLHVLLFSRRTDDSARLPQALGWGMALGAFLITAALVKGPAAGPAVLAAVVVPCILTHSLRPLRQPALWIGLGLSAVVLSAVLWKIASAVSQSGQEPVLQGVTDFLWTGRPLTLASVGEVLIMPVLALLSVLPWALAMVFPWGRDALDEGRKPSTEENSQGDVVTMARAVALTCLISLLFLAVIGVRNPRYAQPCVAFVPVLVGYILWGWNGGFMPLRWKIARGMMLGHPAAWVVLLALAAVLFLSFQNVARSPESGREAGRRLGAHFDAPAAIWADYLIEARPEVLLYAQREAASRGHRVQPRWIPGMAARSELPTAGDYIALRRDLRGNEVALYEQAGLLHRLEPIADGSVHLFDFTLYRVR